MEDSELHKLFLDDVKDIYWAEKHLVKVLPKMQKAATSRELAAAFGKLTLETRRHIETLEEVFVLLNEKAVVKKWNAMEGLLEEAKVIMVDTDNDNIIRCRSAPCCSKVRALRNGYLWYVKDPG